MLDMDAMPGSGRSSLDFGMFWTAYAVSYM